MQSPRFRSSRLYIDQANQDTWIDQRYFAWRYGTSISGLTRLHLADKWWAQQGRIQTYRVSAGSPARLSIHPYTHYTRPLHSENVQIQRRNRSLGIKYVTPHFSYGMWDWILCKNFAAPLLFHHNTCPFQENLPSQTGHLSVEKRPEFCNAILARYTVQASNRKTALVARGVN